MPFETKTEAFRSLSQALNRSFTLREALDAALPQIIELAEAEAGWIFLYNPESGTASLAADVNLPSSLVVAGKRRMAGECRCLQMLREGLLTQPVNVIDCQRLEQALPGSGRRQHATVPLLSQNDAAVGVLNLMLPRGRELSDRDLNVLEALGHEVAVAVQRAQLFETVRDREARTRELMQRLMTTQEEERRRIAQDLHDHAGQIMTALIIQLSHLASRLPRERTETISGELGRLRDIAEQGLDDVHKLVYDLRPLVLDDHGLDPAVRSYIDTHIQPTGIDVDFQIVGLDERLSAETEIAAYRIIQEAVTNTLRHAEARRIEIRLDRRKDWLIVMVRDDGKGFEMDAAHHHTKSLGMHGMRERAELVGGSLQVLSVPGAGTTILARLPLLDRRA